jgi:hypothetical protein
MTRLLLLVSLCICAFGSLELRAGSGSGRVRKALGDSTRAPLELVFCLDLSGSTNGVLSDLRERYWTIVNQTQLAQPGRELRIGLVGFSRPSFGKENGYVKVLAPISSDLDKAMVELMRLKPYVEKGDQYVSTALKACITGLDWSDDPQADRMVFLVGNGMVSADGYDFTRYSDLARVRDIRVHSLYARRTHGFFKEFPGWKRIAGISGGQCTEFKVNAPDSLLTWPNCTPELLTQLEQSLPASGDSGNLGLAKGTTQESRAQRVFYRNTVLVRSSPSTSTSPALLAADAEEGLVSAPVVEFSNSSTWVTATLKPDFLTEVNTLFLSGAAPEDGVLYRCILNILFKDLGILTVRP